MEINFRIGGIIREALKVVFGNPDVMVVIFSFTIVMTLILVAMEVYQKTRL